jgi:hypothetical protein
MPHLDGLAGARARVESGASHKEAAIDVPAN